MSKLSKNIIIFVFVVLALSGLLYFIQLPASQPQEIGVQTFISEVSANNVRKVEVNGNKVTVTLDDETGTKQIFQKEPQDSIAGLLDLYQVPQENRANIGEILIEGASGDSVFFSSVLPILVPIILFAVIIFFFFRQIQGANNRAMTFGQSGARQVDVNKKDRVTFKDVAGAKEAKEELMEVVEFLKHPKKFLALGAKIPRGVLLMGSPGTGKTMLAKAVAGEADVPFFSISGSEFVEMFVGVGASRVRDLFKKAKKNSPCIVFIDEIDAVGRQRGSGLGGSHDEREQTLNQILVEMDGFDTETNVIVIAATNRPDVLDPALMRPGRFDRQVILDKPDVKERQAILDVHKKNKPLADGADMEEVAKRTPGFSGADLANILNEAAILTARRNKHKISQDELLESIEKVSIGPERKSHLLSEAEKKLTAYHEAGHALVASMLEHADPVHKVSIISRGRAAGYTMTIPQEDKKMQRRSEFVDELAVMLGGHAAEKQVFGEVSTGAHNDLKRATNLARRMITDYGMSETMPPRTFGDRGDMIFLGRELHEQRDYSEKVAERIDEEISLMIGNALETAKSVITKHKTKLEAIVKVLLEKETIERDEFKILIEA
jgi:cell division protease FtsH